MSSFLRIAAHHHRRHRLAAQSASDQIATLSSPRCAGVVRARQRRENGCARLEGAIRAAVDTPREPYAAPGWPFRETVSWVTIGPKIATHFGQPGRRED